MARNGNVNIADLEAFRKQMEENLNQAEIQRFIEQCAKELAARLLAKVIKRTPVGDYSKTITVVAKRDSKKHKKGDTYTKKINPSGKKGGTLRRGWTAKTHEEAESGSGSGKPVAEYANSLKVTRTGDMYTIEIVNPVEYAPYVEYGHRQEPGRFVPAIGKRLKKGWVEGRFMLTISSQEVQRDAPRILEQKLKRKLEECFK